MTQLYDSKTASSVTTLAQKILKNHLYGNLCKEIIGVHPMDAGVFYAPYMPKTIVAFKRLPVNKYKFSRANWYVAEFDWGQQTEVLEWCKQQFGPQPKFPDAWSRWHNRYQEKIYFRDEKDYQWFLLRWGV